MLAGRIEVGRWRSVSRNQDSRPEQGVTIDLRSSHRHLLLHPRQTVFAVLHLQVQSDRGRSSEKIVTSRMSQCFSSWRSSSSRKVQRRRKSVTRQTRKDRDESSCWTKKSCKCDSSDQSGGRYVCVLPYRLDNLPPSHQSMATSNMRPCDYRQNICFWNVWVMMVSRYLIFSPEPDIQHFTVSKMQYVLGAVDNLSPPSKIISHSSRSQHYSLDGSNQNIHFTTFQYFYCN